MISLNSNWRNRWLVLQRIKPLCYGDDFYYYFLTYSGNIKDGPNLWPLTGSDGWGIGGNS